MLELRPKLDVPDLELAPAASSAAGQVRLALEGLGYQPAEIREALRDFDADGDVSVEDMLRAALRTLGRQGQ